MTGSTHAGVTWPCSRVGAFSRRAATWLTSHLRALVVDGYPDMDGWNTLKMMECMLEYMLEYMLECMLEDEYECDTAF